MSPPPGQQGEDWRLQPPYRPPSESDASRVRWTGQCHCGRVQYQLTRERPLASKYCHCTTCQRLHGAPFQWAAVFHKDDVAFTRGHEHLGWYDAGARLARRHLPCKVQCTYCRTPLLDEGRRMALLFPTLVDGIRSERGREAFRVQCHLFYEQRVVDIRGDGAAKYLGMEHQSPRVDDDGNEMVA